MKLAAHPLIVAVALGLVDSSALAALDDTSPRTEPHCEGASESDSAHHLDAQADEAELDELLGELRSILL